MAKRKVNTHGFLNILESNARSLVKDKTLRIVYTNNLPAGSAACYVYPPVHAIYLPKVDTTKMTPAQQIKWNGHTTHECLHVINSDGNIVKESVERGKFIAKLTNVLEDPRIELTPWTSHFGLRQNLFMYRQMRFQEYLDHSEYAMKNPWGYLLMVLIFRLGRYGNLPVPKPMKKYYKIALNILKKGKFYAAVNKGKAGTRIMLDIAQEIYDAWQEERNKEYKEENPEENNDQEKNENNDQNNEDNKDEDNSSNNEGENQDNKNEKKEDNDFNFGDHEDDDWGDEWDGKDTNLDEDEDEDEDSTEKNEAQQSEGMNDDKPKKKRPQSIEDEFNMDNGDIDENGNPQENNNSFEMPKSSDDVWRIDPEELSKMIAQLPDEIKAELMKMIPEATDEEHREYSGDPYIAYTGHDRQIVANGEYVEDYLNMKKSISGHVQRLRQQLSLTLQTMVESREYRGLPFGKFDPRSSYKILNKSNHLYKRTTKAEDFSTAVTLLIDLSGSMSHRSYWNNERQSRAEIAARIALLFGESLSLIPQISYSIRGYNSNDLSDLHKDDAPSASTLMSQGYNRSEVVNHWLFKDFDEPWKKVCFRLGACAGNNYFNAINPEKGGAVGGCNVDHENLYHAAYEILKRTEQKKIIIVLCDGYPSGCNGTYGGLLQNKLHEVIKQVRGAGIKLFCFGIQCEAVRKYYEPDVEIVQSIESLDTMALKKLADYLIH
jgi:cobalamin biosynthesis protein CobT